MTFSNNCGTRFELELKLEIQKLVIFLRENAYFYKTLCSRVRCYKVWLKAQNVKKRCEFTIGKRQAKKVLRNVIWDRLRLHLGGFGDWFGEGFGASWRLFGRFGGSFFRACM